MEHSEGENTPKVAKQVFGKDKEEKVKKGGGREEVLLF